MEGITRDEVQNGLTGGLETFDVVRRDYLHSIYAVAEFSAVALEHDLISVFDVFQHTEMSIAMAGYYAVAVLSGKNGTDEMPRTALEIAIVSAFDNIERRIQTRDGELCYRSA